MLAQKKMHNHFLLFLSCHFPQVSAYQTILLLNVPRTICLCLGNHLVKPLHYVLKFFYTSYKTKQQQKKKKKRRKVLNTTWKPSLKPTELGFKW